ncbi:hypothetical protein [Croceicoccus naphthovorans]|uniref:Uncharacterized protein n=1 Tax=Croceicoccus naphthovorans TaxID=1348774 RepID=A0A0G3XLE3_9SPHN|nr:hypothetical protein [Croceicoccus naphthovorans]AKM11238.1 hypothetical protein AB433_16675 [Croceicoccus naphthovorans]MBB3989857.1 hypothetical protein [Croceicoccus naphthovorans]
MKYILLASLAAALAATPAMAEDGGVMVGVTGGTLGIGPEVTYRMNETIAVRANATFFGYSHDVDSDDVTYDGKLNLQSFGAMIDVHPFGGGFRVSAGARIGDNKVKLKAAPTDDVEIGGTLYTPEEIGELSGEVKAKDFAPMLTLGWAGGLTKGLKLGFEAGAMFHGSPRIDNLTATGILADDPDFMDSLRAEEAEIEDDIDNYKIYPVVQLSVGYRF